MSATDLANGASAPRGDAQPSVADVLNELQRILREALGRSAEAKPSDRLLDELALDSIEAITLAVELENRFRVKLDEQDAGGVSTVEELVALVGRRWLEAQAAEAQEAAAQEAEAQEADASAPEEQASTGASGPSSRSDT